MLPINISFHSYASLYYGAPGETVAGCFALSYTCNAALFTIAAAATVAPELASAAPTLSYLKSLCTDATGTVSQTGVKKCYPPKNALFAACSPRF